MEKPKKILILGSGALKIGQAGEFDYSGSQAIKSFKEEGIKTVLINPNIATIQTSEQLADEVYFLPVTDYFVEKVIEKEKPDAIALSFGGQTALNCGLSIEKKGILKKYGVTVLGTSIEAINIAEDRELFANHLHKIKISTPESKAATSLKEAEKIVKTIGFPVMIRAAFALGGQKSGVAHNQHEFEHIVKDALVFSPQVLIEKYLHHFKEIEYEVVRDRFDNCVTVCNMENMDPLGIHTGESIVVAPSQTLNNDEYHQLRLISMKIVRSLNIVGECNVQFALNPNPKNGKLDYYVIEVNPRLSRSSALASKATGYPLAYVASKLILGKSLMDVKNQVTQITQSFFEPALDYVVVKIPRWDLEKFRGVDVQIGSSMKSVGEVMAIGRTFEEAIQKAVRMLDIGVQGVSGMEFKESKEELNEEYIKIATPKRVFALMKALRAGISVEEIYKLSGIDPWFLYRLQNIDTILKKLENLKITEIKEKTEEYELLLEAKQNGISDKRISQLTNTAELQVRETRKKLGIKPSVFQIDTLAGEFPAQTNYLYTTYNGGHDDVEPVGKEGIMVLGSGPYRIGSSVEFDWTCVNTAQSLKNHGKKSILVNCNPETVSTDYDMSDRLYFEELSFERVSDIFEFENLEGIVVSVGGQTPNNIAQALHAYGVPIIGTQAEDIDRAEDRTQFSDLLDKLNIPQPAWNKFTKIESAIEFSNKVGFPVLIRPSYVLSGSAMTVCNNEEELRTFIQKATIINTEHPIIVSKFHLEAKEIELDGVAQNGEVMVYAVSEHVENAGVHSGDATIAYPPQKIYLRTEQKVIEEGHKIAKALNITGPFNIQFLGIENNVSVIEVNLRASRTFPFISKATRVNFAKVIVDSFFGKAEKKELSYPDYVLVKIPQFSFSRLAGADPVLHVEMSSTGEAAAFGDDIEEAFLKAQLSVGERIPQKGIFLSVGGLENKMRFILTALRLKSLGLPLYATEQTHRFLQENGIKATKIHKIREKKDPNALSLIQSGKIDLVINIIDVNLKKDRDDGYIMRRAAIDHNIHIITNRQKAALFIKAIYEKKLEDLKIKAWSEYK